MRTIEEIKAERDEARRVYRASRGASDARTRAAMLQRIEAANWEIGRRESGQPVARVVRGTADLRMHVIGERSGIEMPSEPDPRDRPLSGVTVALYSGERARLWAVTPSTLVNVVSAVAEEAAVNPGFYARLAAYLMGGADRPLLPERARKVLGFADPFEPVCRAGG